MENELLSFLPADFPWRESIHYLESVDSTSNYAKKLAKDGAPQGTTVIAKAQTGGRGRMGRSFHSPMVVFMRQLFSVPNVTPQS